MFARGLLVVALMLVLPIHGYAWTLSARVMTGGGSMQVGPETYTSGNGTVTRSYTVDTVPVTLQAGTGYRISAVNVNGSALALPPPNPILMGPVSYPGRTSQSISVSFAKMVVSVSATATTSGGAVSPTGTQSLTFGSTATYTFTPNSGMSVVAISGLPAGAQLKAVSNGATVTLPYPGAVRATFSVPAQPVTIGCSFIGIAADAGLPQTALTGSTVVLGGSSTVYDGSPPESVSYLWTQLSGPQQLVLTGADTRAPYFATSGAGSYWLQLRATSALGSSGTATVNITVSDSAAAAARHLCQGCHSQAGIGVTRQVFNTWSSSAHKSNVVMCSYCHVGTDTGAHPGDLNSSTVNITTFVSADTGQNFCLQCHSPAIGTGFAAGPHGSVITCSSCHVDAHLAQAFSPTSFRSLTGDGFTGPVLCFNCHNGTNGTHYHSEASLDNSCNNCHTANHNPSPAMVTFVAARHFNGYTSYSNPNYATAYVTPVTSCTDCHRAPTPASGTDIEIKPYRVEWASSPHDSPLWKNSAEVNWKAAGTRGADAVKSAGFVTDCQRCHTTDGFLRYVANLSLDPVAPDAPRYSEPLTCKACHLPGQFNVIRGIGARTAYYNYSSEVTGRVQASTSFPDSGRSNLCLGCHTGRVSGDTIKMIAAATVHESYSSSFWQETGYLNGHYLSGGGELFGRTGYQYPGVNYANAGVDHSRAGSVEAGACVACHMPGSTHTLDPAAGSYALCNGCHRGSGLIDSAFLAQKSAGFNAALKALAEALTRSGFAPTLDAQGVMVPPYFSARNWGSKDSAPGNMGAAFNLNMLSHDPGAFAHNPTYAKRLVRDSIDYLVNGKVDRGSDLDDVVDSLLTDATLRSEARAFLMNSGKGTAACQVCHSDDLDPATGDKIFALYDVSTHALEPAGASCADCHAPGPAVAHPYEDMLSDKGLVSDKCLACHPAHTWSSAGKCMECHNPHKPENVKLGFPHYNNFSTAQYVTTNVGCDNCHTTVDGDGEATFNIYSANTQWARTGKGNITSPSWTGYDFKTLGVAAPATAATSARDNCVRCHTTTGYINYVTTDFKSIAPWGKSGLLADGDRSREMVACSACHNPTPFSSDFQYDEETDTFTEPFSRRRVPQVTVYYNFSSAGAPRVINPQTIPFDVGESNNCIVCHSGKVAGSSLRSPAFKVASTDPFWNSTPLIDPHGMSAAGILFAKSGYQFGNYYSGSSPHAGLDWDSGPCIACHMFTDEPHLFSPVAKEESGAISSVTAVAYCSPCHPDMDAAFMNGKKGELASSLKALSAALAQKGIHFNPGLAPYFFNVPDPAEHGAATVFKSWGSRYLYGVPELYKSADVMGAAFNLRLLWSESGAYAHNPIYARRLIYDSIDLIDDGMLKNNSVYNTIGLLPLGSGFTLEDRVTALTYVGTRP